MEDRSARGRDAEEHARNVVVIARAQERAQGDLRAWLSAGLKVDERPMPESPSIHVAPGIDLMKAHLGIYIRDGILRHPKHHL